LLELFLERTPVRLEEMQRAVESCDLTHLRQVAHQLKSTSANIGARRFRELCIEIEKAENLGDVGALLGQLITEYQLIQRALEAELERNR
jgi:HPt (histidine-containing phosphotransfer) domain-containing protein